MKKCSRCKHELPFDQFGPSKASADGRCYWCRPCKRAYRNAYNSARREHIAQQARQWRKANPESVAEIERRWRKANVEKVRAKGRRRYARLRASIPDELRRQSSERQQRRRARMAAAITEVIDRQVVFERDQWMCQICHEAVLFDLRWPDPRSPSLDHRVPLFRGGAHTYANAQLAHLVWNQAKGASIETDGAT